MGLSQVTIDIGNIAIGIELDCTSEGSGLIIYGASLEGTLYNLPLPYLATCTVHKVHLMSTTSAVRTPWDLKMDIGTGRYSEQKKINPPA